MTQIGLLSDTHNYLDPRVFEHFEQCDEIWHAGDIGTLKVTDELAQFKPTRAVYGNIDGNLIRQEHPLNQWFTCEDLSVWMTHIAGTPPRYTQRIKAHLATHTPPDIFVCGHSHILKILRVPAYNNMLHINPGAAGNRGFHRIRTLVRFKVAGKRLYDCEVIELGTR